MFKTPQPWGPTPPPFTSLPFAPYNRTDRLGKLADWTVVVEATKDQPPSRRKRIEERDQYVVEDSDSFRVVDRQAAVLRKSAVRSVKPVVKVVVKGVAVKPVYGKRVVGFGNKVNLKPRDPSIKVVATWKLVQELNFSRMTGLHLEVDEPKDIAIMGSLSYYDKAFDKITTRSETNLLTTPEKVFFNPTACDDPTLLGFAGDLEGQVVVATDTALAALMTCLKSVYSFDLIVTKKDKLLSIDKRENVLDVYSVNENAAETPVAAVGKDSNINTLEALANEAHTVSRLYSQQILKAEETVSFSEKNPFVLNDTPEVLVASGAYRYRNWDLGNMNLLVRSNIHSCLQTKNTATGVEGVEGLDQSTHPLSETTFVNTYALLEFDHRAIGAGGSFEWRKKLDGQRGAVIATEMKNNAAKLARWTMESLLAGVEYIRLGFVSRTYSKDRNRHQILGSSLVKPIDFAAQISFDIESGWGIAKALIDLLLAMEDGKYVILRDPTKQLLSIYQISPK